MRYTFPAFALLFASSFTHAKEYGHHDPKRMLIVSATASGKSYKVDVVYLDHMLNDLALYAQNYPPRFDTTEDRQRAIQDVRILSGMLDVLVAGPNPGREVLARAGFLNSMGHNLDIPGSAEKASAIFRKLLVVAPSDPRANYMYGTFLAGTGKSQEALSYLQSAHASGVADAAYSLGMVYLALGDKPKALSNLETYRQGRPDDGNLARLIEGIRNGKVEVRRRPD